MKQILLFTALATCFALSGCSKGEDVDNSIQLSSSDQTMYYDDEFQINATSNTPITYSSEDKYHAEVSESGLVTAGRVVETNIVLTNGSDTKKLKITVRPESNLYPEPDITFGMSRSAVKAKLGTPQSEEGTAVGWINYSPNAPILMCTFDEADKLKSYVAMVKTAYSSELATFLVERYVVLGSQDYTYAFMNGLDKSTVTMGIGAKLYNISYWMTMYFPFTLTSRSVADVDYSDIMKSIDALINK